VATLVLLADLGFYSVALGSAELLANGDNHFEAGDADVSPTHGQAMEFFPSAILGFTVQADKVKGYRSFRLVDLYTVPPKD
jgi:hypothetical protein